ncbi:hypothetical protein AHF37_09709 [Paragonimus kellicotti]|nr:hypothetical protein AHF37_09709 [Paragonimus kellicotti]
MPFFSPLHVYWVVCTRQDTSVAKLFNRVRSWYLNPEAISGTNEAVSPTISHWACARVMHAVARHCPELLYAHAGITLPLIFLNRQPEPEGAGTTYATIDYTVTHQNTLSLHDRTSDVIELDSNSKGKRPSVVTGEQSDEFEALRPLWQETWEELLAKSPTSSYPAQLLWPCNGGTGTKFFAPACALLTSFLRTPMLEHCIQLIREALLECPSWSVRTQAASAVLHLAARLIGQPAVPSHLAATHSRPTRTSSKQSECSNSVLFPRVPMERKREEEEEEEEASEDDEVDEEGEEVAHAEKEWVAQAWVALVHITAEGLAKSKPWPGKVSADVCGALLSVRHVSNALILSGPVIVLKLSCRWPRLPKPSGKDAVLSEEAATENVSNEADSEDRLSSLFRLIVPHWTGREKRTDQGKALTVCVFRHVIELDSNSKGKRPSVVTGEQSDEFEALRPLWQETWEELLAKSPTSSYPAQLLWPCNGGTGTKFFAPACALLTSFLRTPMLEHCIQLIREALLECPSWSVRTQAASAVLHLAARLIGQPAVPSHLAATHSRPTRTSSKAVRMLEQRPFPPGSDGTGLPTTTGGEPIVCRGQHATNCIQLTEHSPPSEREEEEEEEEEASEDDEVDEEGEEVAHAEKEWVAQAWVNPELSDSELELAVRALGILWPMRQTNGHHTCPLIGRSLQYSAFQLSLCQGLRRPCDYMNFVLTQGSRRVQAEQSWT